MDLGEYGEQRERERENTQRSVMAFSRGMNLCTHLSHPNGGFELPHDGPTVPF